MTKTADKTMAAKYEELQRIGLAIQEEYIFARKNNVFSDKNIGTKLYAWHEIMIDESLLISEDQFAYDARTSKPKNRRSEMDFSNDMGALVLACVWGRAKFPFTVELPMDLYKTYNDHPAYRTDRGKVVSRGERLPASLVKPEELEKTMLAFAQQIRVDQTQMEEALKSGQIDWSYIVLTLAKHHIMFETIHPFDDFNGRIGRHILSYEANYLGIPEFPLLREQKQEYFQAFSDYQNIENDPDVIDDLCLDMARLFARNLLSTYITFNRQYAQEFSDRPLSAKIQPDDQSLADAEKLSARLERHQEPERYGGSKSPDTFVHEDLEYLGHGEE